MEIKLKIYRDWDASDTVGTVSAGSGLIGGIWDAITASHRQADANNFNLGMYQLQRADALSDWKRQNEYNAPAAVMSRYKAAGLNPNLIYGQPGLASPAIRSSQPQPAGIAPATAGKAVADVLPNFLDTQMKQATIDNTRQMLDNMRSDNLIKQADLVKKNMENIITSFNPLVSGTTTPTGKEEKETQEEFKYNMDVGIKQEQWNNLTRTGNVLSETTSSMRIDNAVKAALQESNITIGMQKAFQSLMDSAKSEFEVKNLDLLKRKMLNDLELQNLEIDQQQGGFNSKSPLWQKVIGGLIDAAVMYSTKGAVSTGGLQKAVNPADPNEGYRLLQTRTYQKR